MTKTPSAAVSSASQPVTLRQIAVRAKASVMTVSRALGNRARVAASTRERVLRIAEALGYRPDPEINKLMHHLRSQRRRRFQSVICGLSTRTAEMDEPYFLAVVAGAKRQAESRGYGFMLMRIESDPVRWAGLHRSLRARGVQGVLLLPQREPIDLRGLLDWREFSVVAATSSVLAPEVNSVTPHHFANALLLCRQLAGLGYRRPGLVINTEHDRRVEHLFDAAFTWHGAREVPERVPPLLCDAISRQRLIAWWRRERPDVLVATEEGLLPKYARWLGPKARDSVGLASTNVRGLGELEPTGIDERPAEIGAAAVNLLASMIERRERGLPVSPTTTLLPGIWCPGRTVRMRPPAWLSS